MKPLRLILAAAIVLWAASAYARIWTDKFGSQIEGTFVRVHEDMVILQRGTKVIKIPRSTLCEEDQEYVRQQMEAKAQGSQKLPKSSEETQSDDGEGDGGKHSGLGPERTWTNDKGRKVRARLVRVEGEIAVLLYEGREIKAPLAKLSPEDQWYVKSWQAKRRGNDSNPDDGKSPFTPAEQSDRQSDESDTESPFTHVPSKSPSKELKDEDSDSPFTPSPSKRKSKPPAKELKDTEPEPSVEPESSSPPAKQPSTSQPYTVPANPQPTNEPEYTPPPQNAPPPQYTSPPQSFPSTPYPVSVPDNNNPPGQGSPQNPAITGQAVAVGIGFLVVAAVIGIAIGTVIGALFFMLTCWLFVKMFGRNSIPMPNFSIAAGVAFTTCLVCFGISIIQGLMIRFVADGPLQMFGIYAVSLLAQLVATVKIISSALPTSVGKAIALMVMQWILCGILIFLLVFFFAGVVASTHMSTH